MRTALVTHLACLHHATPIGHPECADRLRAVTHALEHEDFCWLIREEAPQATRDQLLYVHPESYIDALEARMPAFGEGYDHLDADTVISEGTWDAALRAAGAGVAAVDGVLAGDYDNAFCAVRPPGHHAEPSRAMGCCLFSNAAIAALHARHRHGLKRVAVIDFDVHHGNGTQAVAERDPDLFYGSIHESDIYPNTGFVSETGPANNIVNAPVPTATDGTHWRAAFDDYVIAGLEAFGPELIVISAGFDGHREDPLASLKLTERDFAYATHRILEVARRRCSGRVVSTLEGGYDLDALARSAAAHVRMLMDG